MINERKCKCTNRIVGIRVLVRLLGFNVNTVVDLGTNFEDDILPSVYNITCTWALCGSRLRHMYLPSALYFEPHENKYRTTSDTRRNKVQATIELTHACRCGTIGVYNKHPRLHRGERQAARARRRSDLALSTCARTSEWRCRLRGSRCNGHEN